MPRGLLRNDRGAKKCIAMREKKNKKNRLGGHFGWNKRWDDRRTMASCFFLFLYGSCWYMIKYYAQNADESALG